MSDLPIKLSPISVFTNTRLAAQFWFYAFCVAVTWSVISPYLVIMAQRQKLHTIIIDKSGNILYSPVLGFSENGAIQGYESKLAALCCFQRNPKGSDFVELIDKLFTDPAKTKIKLYLQNQDTEFVAKQIHQKVEVQNCDIISTETDQGFDKWVVEVKGQLLKTGRVNDLAFEQPSKFVLKLTFLRNEDMLNNGKLPLVVYDVEIQEVDLAPLPSGASTTNPS
jgi:hypothetical protein